MRLGPLLAPAFAGLCLISSFDLASASVSDENQIEAIFSEDFVEHWNNSDPEGLAALWTEDGQWLNLIGSRRLVLGREEITKVWQRGLEGRSVDQLSVVVEIGPVLRLSRGVFQVDALMTYGSTQSSQVREAMIAVVVKTAGTWKIASARVARLPK